MVVVATLPDPLPVRSVPATRLSHPVPPFATWRMPVMSEVRLTSEDATTPAVALRKPDTDPREKFDAKRFVDEAIVANKFVDVALVVVELTPAKFCSVVEPVSDRLFAAMVPVEVALPTNKDVAYAFVDDDVPANKALVVPCPPENTRFVVDALDAKKFVEVALVDVERVIVPLVRKTFEA
jgi:hypothetical protein